MTIRGRFSDQNRWRMSDCPSLGFSVNILNVPTSTHGWPRRRIRSFIWADIAFFVPSTLRIVSWSGCFRSFCPRGQTEEPRLFVGRISLTLRNCWLPCLFVRTCTTPMTVHAAAIEFRGRIVVSWLRKLTVKITKVKAFGLVSKHRALLGSFLFGLSGFRPRIFQFSDRYGRWLERTRICR